MTAPDTVRCFVALPVPAHVRTVVSAATAPARAVGTSLTWTRPEGWHVTLAFLGDVARGDLDQVGAVIAGVAAAADPMTCEVGEVGRFGRRALWLAVDDAPTGAIARLAASLQSALVEHGALVEERSVHPHLTIARASRRGADLDVAAAAVASVRAGWEANTIELVRSEVGDGPARYTAMGSWHLGGSP